MPKVGKYLSGFGLQEGSYLDGYFLAKISAEHVSVRRYREYQYPVTMTWQVYDQTANYSNLFRDLSIYLSGDRTIYTSYGNPYQCNFGQLSLNKITPSEVVITARGTCQRIFNNS